MKTSIFYLRRCVFSWHSRPSWIRSCFVSLTYVGRSGDCRPLLPLGSGPDPFSLGVEFPCSPFLAAAASSHNPDAQVHCKSTIGVRVSTDKVHFFVHPGTTGIGLWRLQVQQKRRWWRLLYSSIRGNFNIRWEFTDTLMPTGSSGHPWMQNVVLPGWTLWSKKKQTWHKKNRHDIMQG